MHRIFSKNNLFWCLIALIAVGSRFFLLGERSFWYDEALSFEIAKAPVWQIMGKTSWSGDENPPLYFLLLHFWLYFGKSECVIRLLSLLFGLLSFPLLYATAKTIFNREVARISLLLFAFSWLHIRYSQEARPYSLFVFFSLASVYFLFLALRENRFRDWGFYILFAVLNLFTHIFSLLLIFSQLIFLLLISKKKGKNIFFLVVGGFLLSFFIPPLQEQYLHLLERHTFLLADFSWVSPIRFLSSMLAGFSSGHPSLPLGFFSIPLVCILLGKMLVAFRRERSFQLLFLLTQFGLPLLGAALASFFVPDLFIRYMVFLLPIFLILVSRGISLLPSRSLKMGAIIILLLLNSIQLFHYYRDIKGNPHTWKKLCAWIETKLKPGEIVAVFPEHHRLSLQYYLKKEVSIKPIPSCDSVEFAALMGEASLKNIWFVYSFRPHPRDAEEKIYQWVQQRAEKTGFPELFFLPPAKN
ncbi:MAG: glycosyltransferase family 39 protein [Deltaproteobacteria bacterium]|nr:glycosyltransferase family 39 protein [Deltaproteobacteria bacterium]